MAKRDLLENDMLSPLGFEFSAKETLKCPCIAHCAVLRWVTQSCLILFQTVDCSPPGSSVHGILQARIPQISAPKEQNRSHACFQMGLSFRALGCFRGDTPCFVSYANISHHCSDSHPKAECPEVGSTWTALVHSTRRWVQMLRSQCLPTGKWVVCTHRDVEAA